MKEIFSCITILPFIISSIFFIVIKKIVYMVTPRQFRRKKSITGQNILVTGAANGLGRELAIEFSKHSVNLILVDIERESLIQTKDLIDKRSRAFTYVCDVSNREMVYRMAGIIKEEVGDVDILVNNAGICNGKYLMDLTDEEIQRTVDVNLLAHFWTCKAFLPPMMQKNSGHIVSVASPAGKITNPQAADYCASKAAVIAFSECVEIELRERNLHGIKVMVVYPGHMDTALVDGFKITLCPRMKANRVAREVVDGILEEKETISVPWWIEYALALKEFAPRERIIKFCEITGNLNCMKNFKGRTRKLED